MRLTSIFILGGKKGIREVLEKHLKSLKGCCELCGIESPLYLDHEHELESGCGDAKFSCINCGEARGYLCRSCNTQLIAAADECIRNANKSLISKTVMEYLNDSSLRWYHIMCHPCKSSKRRAQC